MSFETRRKKNEHSLEVMTFTGFQMCLEISWGLWPIFLDSSKYADSQFTILFGVCPMTATLTGRWGLMAA